MNILGINAYHGDASAALIQDGQVVAACEEERFNRIKHCAGFPKLAIRACLKEAGLSLSDIDAVGISRDPKANLSSKVLYAIRHGNHLSKFIGSRISNAAKIFNVQDKIEQALDAKGALKAKVYAVEHHLAHMASGFFASPFESSAVMSIDGFGDFVSTKWGKAEGNQINILGQVQFPHSLGILYTAVTQYLGFPNYGDEYKVMGLAALGEAVFSGEFGDMIQCGSNNSSNGFKLNLDYFTHHRDGIEMNWEKGYPNLSACFSKKMTEKFGPARNSKEPITGHHKNIAASLQKTYENIFFHLLNSLQRQTGSQNLCLAGGCALNAVANGKIRAHTGFQNVFVQPAAGDAGTALG
ncbi:MAG: carbamoyltransferase, partial [Candidatus Omnitrophica bacterium]|nr:carbamoyltransferase [Candidatus Omnitrophota bacterium]